MAHAQRRRKQPWVLEAIVMQQSADKGQMLWFRPSSTGHVWRGSVGRRRRSKTSVVKKAPHHLHPRDRSSTFCTGTHYHPVYPLMLPNRVSTDARTWLADGPRRRCDSHSRVAVVSAAKVARTGGNVNPLLSRSSTP
jgi:hypothetical protein